jgi:hypothetical protein
VPPVVIVEDEPTTHRQTNKPNERSNPS